VVVSLPVIGSAPAKMRAVDWYLAASSCIERLCVETVTACRFGYLWCDLTACRAFEMSGAGWLQPLIPSPSLFLWRADPVQCHCHCHRHHALSSNRCGRYLVLPGHRLQHSRSKWLRRRVVWFLCPSPVSLASWALPLPFSVPLRACARRPLSVLVPRRRDARQHGDGASRLPQWQLYR
jgi:hypothetical protein